MDCKSSKELSEGKEERSLEDINSILSFAKFSPADFKSDIQCLSFSHDLDNENVKLLELDPNILAAFTEGQKVEIRGDPSESAVLVTEALTYEIKEAETSNSLLLMPQMSFGDDLSSEGEQKIVHKQFPAIDLLTDNDLMLLFLTNILTTYTRGMPVQKGVEFVNEWSVDRAQYVSVCCVKHDYFELRPIKPRLKKLRTLLEENPYRGRECEGDEEDTGRKFSMSHLKSCVQASNDQIKEGLRKLNACEINGVWRSLDFDFLTTVLHHIIQLCEERDWFDDGIDEVTCCEILEELFPREIILHLIHSFSRAVVETEEGQKPQKYFLCEDKICKHFAELCLRNSGKFNLSDFLRTWQESVPNEMKTSLSQLEGMALTDRESHPPVIWYYRVEDLPEDISERFQALFEERKKWSLEEITPFIKDLTNEKLDVGALLTKHARASLQNGIKVFSSR